MDIKEKQAELNLAPVRIQHQVKVYQATDALNGSRADVEPSGHEQRVVAVLVQGVDALPYGLRQGADDGPAHPVKHRAGLKIPASGIVAESVEETAYRVSYGGGRFA